MQNDIQRVSIPEIPAPIAEALSPLPPAATGWAAAPPLWVSALFAAAMVALMAFVRLKLMSNRMVPIAYGVPLVMAVWFRSRIILWAMVIAFTAISVVKIASGAEGAFGYHDGERWLALFLVEADMLVVAGFVHYVIAAREHAETRATELQRYSEQLLSRESQIVSQNRELQALGEELQTQAEELERQSEELRVINEELESRERLLETLLELSHSLTVDTTRPQLVERLSRTIDKLIALKHHAGVAILKKKGDVFEITASTGFDGALDPIPIENSLAALVLERGEVGYIADLKDRPDILVPKAKTGRVPRSTLAAPLKLGTGRIATLEIFTFEPHEWTRQQIAVVESLASQTSVTLTNIGLIEELDRRRRDAEEAAIRKTRFLAAVSHDIRTPANAINLVAELLLTVSADGPHKSDAEIPQLARELRDGALALVQLVSDVLDVTRYDYGKIELQISEFPLSKLFDDQLRNHRSIAAHKGITLSAGPAPSIMVRTDAVKLGRVLSNLLGNALKFTNQGGTVTLSAHVMPDGRLALGVTDTGHGIHAEYQELIFDEFYQVKNPARDRAHGTGLGLAICKRLVEAMNGTIDVSSEIDRGSTFTVTLPADVLVPQSRATLSPAYSSLSSRPNSLDGMCVLLVEDHDVTRLAVSHLLRGAGGRVVEAPTVSAAMARLDDSPCDAVLLDMMLPDGDGREVLARLQSTGRPNGLKTVLVLTGDVTQERIDEVHRLGADGLLHKPIDPNAVITFLRENAEKKSA